MTAMTDDDDDDDEDICLCRPGKCQQYSLTSHKQPAEMSSLCGHLREVVSYKILDHNG